MSAWSKAALKSDLQSNLRQMLSAARVAAGNWVVSLLGSGICTQKSSLLFHIRNMNFRSRYCPLLRNPRFAIRDLRPLLCPAVFPLRIPRSTIRDLRPLLCPSVFPLRNPRFAI